MTAAPPARDRADSCPGALQTHAAADGALARVRVPGGVLTSAQLGVLAAAARDLGDGALELTSRGNLQVRGLDDGDEDQLAERLAAAGLLPTSSHERVRNILASTLSGRTPGGYVDARPWVAALDAAVCADGALADLPGRFLFTLDDGRGDIAGLGGDVGLLALDGGAVALLLGGADSGLRARPDGAVGLALAAARAFLAERSAQGGSAWRLAELADGATRVAGRLSGEAGPRVTVPAATVVGPVGAIAQAYGLVALVGVVPFGRIGANQAQLLARLCAEVQVTPWRSIAVPDLPENAVDDVAVELFRTGMVFDEANPWLRVTACTGRPGCAKALADVRAEATDAVRTGTLPASGARQHWAGCERRCGRPRGHVVDVVATGAGYRVGTA